MNNYAQTWNKFNLLTDVKREWSELILSWRDIDFLLFYDFVAEIYKK